MAWLEKPAARTALAGALAALASASAASAQNDAPSTVVRDLIGQPGDADSFRLPTDFPTSPAHAVLGEDPAALQNVRNFEEVGVQVLSGLDDNYALTGEGIGFGGRPYWWGDRADLSLCRYSGGQRADDGRCVRRDGGGSARLGRIYQRSHVSVATLRKTTETNEQVWRMGLAWTTELLDQQDIRYLRPLDPGAVDQEGYVSTLGECLAERADVADGEVMRLADQRALDQTLNAYPLLNRDSIDRRVDDSFTAVAESQRENAFARHAALALGVTDEARAKGYDFAAIQAIDALFTRVFDQELPRPAEDLKDEVYDACLQRRDDELAQRASLRVGVAHALTSETGKLDDFEGEALSLWVSGRWPTPEIILNSSANGFVQYDVNRLVELAPEPTQDEGMDGNMDGGEEPGAMDGMSEALLAEADRLQASLGYAIATDRLTLAASVSYVDLDFTDPALPDDSYTLVSVTASKRIREGVWLELGVGKSDSDRLADDEYVNLRLKVDWNAFMN